MIPELKNIEKRTPPFSGSFPVNNARLCDYISTPVLRFDPILSEGQSHQKNILNFKVSNIVCNKWKEMRTNRPTSNGS